MAGAAFAAVNVHAQVHIAEFGLLTPLRIHFPPHRVLDRVSKLTGKPSKFRLKLKKENLFSET